jgi:hypothetical protein
MLLLPNEVLTLRNISRILEAYGWGSGAAPEGLDSIEFRIAGAGAGKLPVELRRYPWGFRFRSEWRLMADEALQAKLALVNDLSNSVPGAAFVYRGTPVDPEHHEKPVPGLCHGICYLPAAAGVTWLQFTIALMRTVSSTTHAAQIARDRGLLDEEQWPDGFIFNGEQS